jgi:CheY-like chemotaxis protein
VPAILCVDDDRNLCQILAKTFSLEGWDVRLAHDGDAALRSLDEAPVDLMLLDLLLPKRDGFSVLEAVRGLPDDRASLPVILMSGCTRTPQYEERAQKLGAGAFLTKPVPLADLLRLVGAKLGDRPGAIPADGAAPTGVPAAKVLAGSLAELPFPALLHHLHGLRANGVLHLVSGKRRKAIQLRDGYPVAVRSNLVNECLGNMLARMGHISQVDLAESLRRVQDGEGLQGEILLAMKVLSEQELALALRTQAEEKLFEVFEWRDGQYRLELGARIEGANGLSLGKSPANVILHGVRTRFPLERVDAWLGAHADFFLAPNESPFYRFQEIDLDPGEAFLLRALDGTMRLRELGDQGDSIRRTLYALLACQLVEARSSSTPGGASVASPAYPVSKATPDPEEEALRNELTSLAERMRGKTYFEILGLPESASDDDVRRAYVELAKRTHPDRFSGASDPVRRLAEEVFGLISKANEALADLRGRTTYMLELRRGQRAAAELEEAQKVLQAERQFQQGEVKLKRRDYAGAIESFDWSVRLYPQEGEYHAHLAWARYLADPSDESNVASCMDLLKKAIKLAPEREKPYLFLGRMCQAAGRADTAEKMFTRAVQIQPDCVEALRELRLMHMRREKEKGLIGRLLRR